MEDYYKQHPTTTSTTSSSTEASAEDDEGDHGEENTAVAGEEGSGKAVPEEGEDSNEEAATEGVDKHAESLVRLKQMLDSNIDENRYGLKCRTPLPPTHISCLEQPDFKSILV